MVPFLSAGLKHFGRRPGIDFLMTAGLP